MIRPTEEMLGAYVDGALDPETEQSVMQYLAKDAEARAYVEALRRINELSPKALDDLVQRPPQSLVDAITAKVDAHKKATARAPRSQPRAARLMRTAWAQPYAIAAMLVATFGLAVAYTTLIRPNGPTGLLAVGPLASGSAIAALLERGRPQDTVSTLVVENGRRLRVALASTFMDKQSRYCREIEIGAAADDIPQSASIACRAASGGWAVEGSVALKSNTSSPVPGIAPSGSDDDEPLTSLLRTLGAGRALTSEQVEAALASGWK
jgi:hypothetical protein